MTAPIPMPTAIPPTKSVCAGLKKANDVCCSAATMKAMTVRATMVIVFALMQYPRLMNAIVFGLIAGVIFGAVDAAMMIPMPHPNKGMAMLGAFASRFAIGFLIAVTRMPVPPWVRGVIVGVLISIPD